MPAAVADDNPNAATDTSEMWKSLKRHILNERARKRQEREAEVEEERQRKEREAREQQDVMTLGETREQISQLECKLTQLKEEKHQLFLQLKKVLNEDDNRRRQLLKENTHYSEMLAVQGIPSGLVHQPLYISQAVPRAATVSQLQSNFKPSAKRPRSPSPQPVVPVSLYHQGYGYKPPNVGTSYQNSPQKDDGRRNEIVRAVLWNKSQPYGNQPSAFYPVPPQELSIYYPGMTSREQPRNVYEAPRPQTFHLEQKLPDHYALRTPSSHGHVIHSINPAQPPSKTGSITAGYPVRSQTQYQQQPAYTTQGRTLYQSPGGPMNFQRGD